MQPTDVTNPSLLFTTVPRVRGVRIDPCTSKTNEKGRTQERERERAEGESKLRLIRRLLETTKEHRANKRLMNDQEGMGYKGVCIHDREWKRVKVVNECDRCVGSTYPKSETSRMMGRGIRRRGVHRMGGCDEREDEVRGEVGAVRVLYIL